jgi:hypothetical protein
VGTYPNLEQQTFSGHFCCPSTPYCPQSALESHFEVQFPAPHSEGEKPHNPFVPQHAAIGQGVSALQVPIGSARVKRVSDLASRFWDEVKCSVSISKGAASARMRDVKTRMAKASRNVMGIRVNMLSSQIEIQVRLESAGKTTAVESLNFLLEKFLLGGKKGKVSITV